MVIKNGLKEYIKSGFYFGLSFVLLFIFFDLTDGNGTHIIFDILLALGSGFVCGFFIYPFSIVKAKKASSKRVNVSADKKVICDGPGTYLGTGGWLFYTDKGFEFYPHKANMPQKEINISKENIKAVNTRGKKLIVETNEDTTIQFIVAKNSEWIDVIQTNS